jgi:hypothetical protein
MGIKNAFVIVSFWGIRIDSFAIAKSDPYDPPFF